MNPNEMQQIWNSARNRTPTEEQHRLAQRFAGQLIRRRRFQSIWLINTFIWLAVITVLAIRTVAIGKTTPSQEWGLIPLLLVPWSFAILFLRRYLRPAPPIANGEIPIVESLRAALASNRETRSQTKLIGVLYVIMIPFLALAMRQLREVGKVSEREFSSMALFFGAILLVGSIGIAVRYFFGLRPQAKRLNALLSELTEDAAV